MKINDIETAKTPYNFIPFPDQVIYRYDNFENIPKHDYRYDLDEENYSTGYIEYDIVPQTPIYIGSKTGFIKINGRYIIPGSTMKGKIRSNSEIISMAYPKFVEDRQFWYRFLAEKSSELREEYNENLKNLKDNKLNRLEDGVKAGYLVKRGNKYSIIPALENEGHSFKRVRESDLRKMSFAKEAHNNDSIESCFMYKNIDWEKINSYKKTKNINTINKILREDVNKHKGNRDSFKPYQKKVYYKLDGLRVEDISINQKTDYELGYLVNSSNLGNKQVHYLIFSKQRSGNSVTIDKEVVDNFEVSVRYAKNQGKDLFNLNHINTNEKVVFYKLEENKTNNSKIQRAVAFGFTPYLKIPYKYSIKKGLEHILVEPDTIDYVQALFGMANDDSLDKSYKGRVTFSNAIINNADESVEVKTVEKALLGSNPTSFQLYLEQKNNKLDNYNHDDFKLRGHKFYHLKKDGDMSSITKSAFTTTLNAMMPKCENGKDDISFTGRIYFENLTKDELGLLILSLKPFESGFESIGQGKPYGFGRVKLNLNSLNLEKFSRRIETIDESFANTKLPNNEFIKSLICLDKEDAYEIYENSNEIGKAKIESFKAAFIEMFEALATKQIKKEFKLFHYSNSIMNAFKFSKQKIDRDTWGYMDIKEFKDRSSLITIENIMKKELNALKNLDTNLNRSIKIFSERDNSIDEKTRIKKYINILVVSEDSKDEKLVKPIMDTFENVTYKKTRDIYAFTGYDIVILNNLETEDIGNGMRLLKQDITKNMEANKSTGYLIFTSNGGRISLSQSFTHSFANNIVTLENAIIEVAKYRESIKE